MQFSLITSFQFIYSALSLYSGDDSFVTLFAFVISSFGALYTVFMPVSRYQNALFIPFHLLDVFSQLFILVLVYLTMSFYGFYPLIAITFGLSFILFYFDGWSIHIGIIPSIYRFRWRDWRQHIKNTLFVMGVKTLVLIMVTVFVNAPVITHQTDEPYSASLCVAWLLGILPHLIFCVIYGGYHTSIFNRIVQSQCCMAYLRLHDLENLSMMYRLETLSNSISNYISFTDESERKLENYYYQHMDKLNVMTSNIRDVEIQTELLYDTLSIWGYNGCKTIIAGDRGCEVFKRISIDCLGDEEIKNYQEKRSKLVYGYVRLLDDDFDFCILSDMIAIILDFYGKQGIQRFCCQGYHGNKFVDYQYQLKCNRDRRMNSYFPYTHIHDIHSPKLAEKIDTTHKCLLYCVSLLDYAKVYDTSMDTDGITTNKLLKCVEEFGELVRNHAKFKVIMILYVDYYVFEQRIKNGDGLKKYGFDYQGQDDSIDDSIKYLIDEFKKQVEDLECTLWHRHDKTDGCHIQCECGHSYVFDRIPRAIRWMMLRHDLRYGH